ncbi:MAG: NAD+ synthase [Rickettsiales bacterium]|nr:NAD+ synthase [Rickettsiales bacterium]
MAEQTHVALCQTNPILGDLSGNVAEILSQYQTLCRRHDLVVFPELAITGYPPEDLVLLPAFQQQAQAALEQLAAATAGQMGAMLVGGLQVVDGKIYNAAYLLESGEIRHVAQKHYLPNTGVFDEMRVFAAGPVPQGFSWRGRQWAFLICEDMWHPELFAQLGAQGVEIAVVINGSPYEVGKPAIREALAQQAASHGMAILYCNMVGGQDELVFDGASFAMNASGELVHRLASFRVDSASYSLSKRRLEAHDASHALPTHEAGIYAAVCLGLRDYIEKNGAGGVILGLSGGIDSALVACMAVDALGPERVRTVMLTSPYTSAESVEDAAIIAERLGVRHDVLAIHDAMQAMQAMLIPLPEPLTPLALENIQSRLRGQALMALSNSCGWWLLSTGNKSEMAVGYATIYGDMCGAFNPLKDIYKTQVYALAHWRNAAQKSGRGPAGPVIPAHVLTRPPSAELRDNQTDQDSLPDYERLDAMLHGLVEERVSAEVLYGRHYSRAELEKVVNLLKNSEFKRRQAPIGPKITPLGFGRDRRVPITHRFIF